MAAQVRQITNGTLYVAGASMLGMIEEVKLPDFVFAHSEYAAAGMFAKIDLPTGVDKLDVDIKYKSVFEKMFADLANPMKATRVQLRSNVENWASEGVASTGSMVTTMVLRPKKIPTGGTYKQGARVDFSGQYGCTFFAQELDGKELLYYDYFSNLFRINGEDILSDFRANQGS